MAAIAPRLDVSARISDPHLTNAQAANEADSAVDADSLAMISAQPTERRVELRSLVYPHLDARVAERRPPLDAELRPSVTGAAPATQELELAPVALASRAEACAHRRQRAAPLRPGGAALVGTLA
jgi:hypothetical protein